MTYLNNLVEVVGIASCFPKLEGELDFWTQLSIPERVSIPEQKPDAEQLTKVVSEVDIISQKVVKTPISCGCNLAGDKLTGKKLIVEGLLRQKIFYVADLPEQPIHAFHFKLPFSTFVIIDGNIPKSTKFKVIPYIEDIFVKMNTKREIFKNTTLFLYAFPNECSC
ncbi:DUF3794 domain-containing protein [Sporohalobacter salinus]|uniref:DUF3794 domain-containing protein n=1 Tax=Sporohalobacter salinus TaxID=1494606 RepID=UPI0019605919|nr:DUF3794 domain-containing protein [Sporohalobacter salinus]MBM7625126.1 hypothetical protein [Sporohalobacter salinus]